MIMTIAYDENRLYHNNSSILHETYIIYFTRRLMNTPFEPFTLRDGSKTIGIEAGHSVILAIIYASEN